MVVMKIERKDGFDEVFHERIRACVLAGHEILVKAELAMHDVRAHLNGVRIIPSNRMVGSAGRANYGRHSISLNA